MTILETLIQFRRHWRAIDMLLEREINQMQENVLSKEELRARIEKKLEEIRKENNGKSDRLYINESTGEVNQCNRLDCIHPFHIEATKESGPSK